MERSSRSSNETMEGDALEWAAHQPLFVFDLDSTITKCELLPLIAQSEGLGEEMNRLTEKAMDGNLPFEQDFPKRVEMLRSVPISRAREIAEKMPLHEEIADFLREHSKRCMILTGNLDVWIETLIERLGMAGRCICSKALVEGDRLIGVSSVLNKEAVCRKLARPFVAIGDGSNDIGMLRAADMGIAFGGARRLSPAVIWAADKAITDEAELIATLRKLL